MIYTNCTYLYYEVIVCYDLRHNLRVASMDRPRNLDLNTMGYKLLLESRNKSPVLKV
jgi:hypothetical protein